MEMNGMQKTPEQQIDEAVESLKVLFLTYARNQQEADEIRRRLDSVGHEIKAVSAIVNDQDIYKAAIHTILSKMR
jgi:ATP-dependent protease ClpP protease subunit